MDKKRNFNIFQGQAAPTNRPQANTVQITKPRSRIQTTANPQKAGTNGTLQGPRAKSYAFPKTADPFAKMMSDLDSKIAQLRADINSRPPEAALPVFDFSGNLARARAGAQGTITPIYVQKISNFLKKQEIARTEQEQLSTLGREELVEENRFRQEQVGRGKVSAVEDADFAIQNVEQQEGLFQQLEGSQFEEERINAIADVVAAGGAQSGSSRRVLREQIKTRNIQSDEQIRQFRQETFLAERGRDRSLEELAASGEISEFRKEFGIKRINLSLDNFIKNQEISEKIERLGTGIEERNAVATETASLERKGISDFIRQLQKSGRPARDIEAFAQLAGV